MALSGTKQVEPYGSNGQRRGSLRSYEQSQRQGSHGFARRQTPFGLGSFSKTQWHVHLVPSLERRTCHWCRADLRDEGTGGRGVYAAQKQIRGGVLVLTKQPVVAEGLGRAVDGLVDVVSKLVLLVSEKIVVGDGLECGDLGHALGNASAPEKPIFGGLTWEKRLRCELMLEPDKLFSALAVGVR